MDFINNSLIYDYISSNEYGFYTKENYDFFNIILKDRKNLVKVIDGSENITIKIEKKLFFIVILILFFSFI